MRPYGRAVSVAALMAAVMLAGCARQYRLHPADLERPSPWPFVRRNISASGSLQRSGFDGSLDILWEHKQNTRPVGPMTIVHQVLVCPSSRKRIKFFDAETGGYLGRIKSRGDARTGMVVVDSIGCFAVGPRRNRLTAIDLFRGKTLWERPIKDAVPGPIVVNERLIVASSSGLVQALDPVTGAVLWRNILPERLVSGPTAMDSLVLQPGERGRLFVLSAEDGRLVNTMETGGPVLGQVAADSLVYAVTMDGRVRAFDPVTGDSIWTARVDGPIWTAPSIAAGLVVVAGSSGWVTAIDAGSGELRWRFPAVEVVRASPLIVGDWVVVGTMAGKVFVLALADGQPAGMVELPGAIEWPPVSDGSRVFVATSAGRIVCLGDGNDKTETKDHREHASD